MSNLDISTCELLSKLTSISKRGPLIALSRGANAVGKLLQAELGVTHSTTRRNFMYDHTITATTGSRSNTRTNLFACVPDWTRSEIKSSLEHVCTHGRPAMERGYTKALFCTLDSYGPNTFGLCLKLNQQEKTLEEWVEFESTKRRILVWDTQRLIKKLDELKRTAIVTALPVNLNGSKAFHFRYVDILGKPDPTVFLRLIDEGSITLDHCISVVAGKSTAREQGPLFKINSESREELYGTIQRFDLLDL